MPDLRKSLAEGLGFEPPTTLAVRRLEHRAVRATAVIE
jgi:hypothetical protein